MISKTEAQNDFFFEKTTNGKIYRGYKVNVISLLNISPLSEFEKEIFKTKSKNEENINFF